MNKLISGLEKIKMNLVNIKKKDKKKIVMQ